MKKYYKNFKKKYKKHFVQIFEVFVRLYSDQLLEKL